MSRVTLFLAWVLLAAGIIVPETTGFIQEGYTSTAHYLSELGAYEAPYAGFINYAGFLPVGLTTVFLVYRLRGMLPRSPLVSAGLIALLGISVGYLIAVFFRCDAGCPAEGSARQGVHNMAGLIQYPGMIIGLFLIYFGLRKNSSQGFSALTLLTALLVTTGFFLLALGVLPEVKGIWQRLADYSAFLWFLLAVLTHAKPDNSPASQSG